MSPYDYFGALGEKWRAEDAFIGPRLPSALGVHWEDLPDRQVFSHSGRWWIRWPDRCLAQGPFPDILAARSADRFFEDEAK